MGAGGDFKFQISVGMVAWFCMRRQQTPRVLGIETSCDETAAAVIDVRGNRRTRFVFDVRSNVVASQVAIHAKYGGVVPEVAAREHVTVIIPTIERALRGVSAETIDGIAVTVGPGLITSLMVGAETARSLAYAWGKPLIAVNHIEGHVVSSLLPSTRKNAERRTQNAELQFPALALIVSGGHTELLLMRGWGKYQCIGATRDDAAGEAFDKVGKLLGLPYPGGPAVAHAAEDGDPKAFDFPRGMLRSGNSEFSFSGLKTAVRYLVEGQPSFSSSRAEPKAQSRDLTRSTEAVGEIFRRVAPRNDAGLARDICASFQQAVVDVLVAKTVAAAKRYDVKTVLLGGGVAANTALRVQLGAAMQSHVPNTEYRIPNTDYTGDNAAMIAAAGGVRLLLGERSPWQQLEVDANWELGR